MVITLISCNSSNDNSGKSFNAAKIPKSKSPTPTASESSISLANIEVQKVYDELNSSASYSISHDELTALLSDGTITAEEYAELKALAQ